MDGIIGWIISLISGIIGGNLAGSAMKEQSLGALGNSLAGLVGGGLGGQLLSALGVLGGAGAPAGSLDLGSILGNIAGSGVGGAILMAIIGWIKKALAAQG